MIRAALSSLARSLQGASRRRWRAMMMMAVMAVGLTLVGLTMSAADNLNRWTHGWKHGTSAVIFLEPDVPQLRVARIHSALRSLDAVDWVRVVEPERAHERLRGELGDELMNGIDATALPTSIEVGFQPGVRDVALAHPVLDRLMATEGIDDVELVGEWVDDVITIAHGLEVGAGVAFGLALVACAFICFCAMAVRAGDERANEAVFEILAARGKMLRWPLVIEGTLLGLASALVAVLATWVLHQAGAESVQSVASSLFGAAEVHGLSGARIVGLMGLGAASGFIGAFLATGSRAPG